jgi:hypothetical protein
MMQSGEEFPQEAASQPPCILEEYESNRRALVADAGASLACQRCVELPKVDSPDISIHNPYRRDGPDATVGNEDWEEPFCLSGQPITNRNPERVAAQTRNVARLSNALHSNKGTVLLGYDLARNYVMPWTLTSLAAMDMAYEGITPKNLVIAGVAGLFWYLKRPMRAPAAYDFTKPNKDTDKSTDT